MFMNILISKLIQLYINKNVSKYSNKYTHRLFFHTDFRNSTAEQKNTNKIIFEF